MIFDCFMFRDELGMLEVRLREFEDLDVHHILVEAPVSHRGDSKMLHYAENRERFAPWKHRITHVIAEGLPGQPSELLPGDEARRLAWAREHAQRDAAMDVLVRLAAPGDIVLIADVDEFPPWPLPDPDPVVAFRMRLMMYAVDWQYPDLHHCAVAARWDAVRGRGLASVRDGRYSYPAADGGMHLTWLGGVEGQREKLRVTCHTEMTRAEYDRIWSGACYHDGEHHSGTCWMVPVDVDETWPRWIYERKCPASWFRPRVSQRAVAGTPAAR